MRAACVPTTPPPITTTRAGATPGTPPISMPMPPADLRKRSARRLDRQPSGHLAHRRQQRQAAAGIGHRLVGDRGAAGCDQALGLRGVGRKVQIGEEDLALAKLAPFRRLRLLHLDDHVGGRKNLGWRVDDRAPAAR